MDILRTLMNIRHVSKMVSVPFLSPEVVATEIIDMCSRHDVLHTFTPAWFTVCMGTGAMQQVLVNFWYPWYPIFPQESSPQWMRNLGYCFWILDIVLFGLFTFVLFYQWIRIPGSLRKTILDFPSCSYLGAIPIVSSVSSLPYGASKIDSNRLSTQSLKVSLAIMA